MDPSQPIRQFNKYVALPVLLDIVKTKKLTLRNPSAWADKNDVKMLELYRVKKKCKYVCASCFTMAYDSIYHWTAFSKDGVCCKIQFNPKNIMDLFNSYSNLKQGVVIYRDKKHLDDITVDQYPFVKREQFECEKEYRIVMASNEFETFDITLKEENFREIDLPDGMSNDEFKKVKAEIKTYLPNVKVSHSTLNNCAQWLAKFPGIRELGIK